VRSSRLREWSVVALVPFAALVVHELRYLFTYGPAAAAELARTGHSYLHELTPWLATTFALALGSLLVRLARAWRTGEPGESRPASFERLWAAATLVLLAVYAGQESLEGIFAPGHTAGILGVFGDGGLWSLPAAALVGAGVALWIRGSAHVVACVARLRARKAPQPRLREVRRFVLRPALSVPRSPLAASAAGRAPPS
jgi:hypothetical protein